MAIILVDKDGNEVDPKTLEGRDDYQIIDCVNYDKQFKPVFDDLPNMEYVFNDMPKIKQRGQSNRKYKSVSKNKRKMVKASKGKNRKRK